ncbi:MAG: DUF1926 domain-containing protein [Fibrobacteraceae bacterium]|nr:DUF1926 domain-containing protein [Fibrobacteraceae bacterium]
MNRLKLSLLLYVKEPFSKDEHIFDENYRLLAVEIKKFLETSKVRLSLFLPGHIIEAWAKHCINELIWMRGAIREGRLEIVGGGFYDPMLPLFPTRLQELQLQKHFSVVEKIFQAEPSGYFNSSMAWEIGMTETLAKQGFNYALVSEDSLQESLGRSTRVVGWFTTEDRGAVIRLLPVAQDLSLALVQDYSSLSLKVASLPENEKIWVAAISVNLNRPENLHSFFEKLALNLIESDFQLWTLSHIFEQQMSDGRVNLLSSVGTDLGLPTGSHSCRELLIRRPESNFMHKSLLAANRHASSLLRGSDLSSIQNQLLPVMAPVYYADLYEDQGVRSPVVRWKGSRSIISVEDKIAKMADFRGRSVEVTDFLMEGYRQILVNNSKMGFLLEQNNGASLRSLIYKPSLVNMVSAFRQNGDVPVAFFDHLLDPSLHEIKQIEAALDDGAGSLKAPYDYQIERAEKHVDVMLRSEQIANVSSKKHVFHIDKRFALPWNDSSLNVSYVLSNTTFSEFEGYFGTELNLGARNFDGRSYSLKINGSKIPLRSALPLLYPDVSLMEFKDGLLSYAFRFTFSKPAKVALSLILGSDRSAAPTLVQGIRLFFFWNLTMKSQASETYKIQMDLSRRGFFL